MWNIYFTEEVAASAVTEDSYKKIYTPAGGVQTINGIGPVDGNVSIDAGDIPYLSGTVEGTLGDYNTRLMVLMQILLLLKETTLHLVQCSIMLSKLKIMQNIHR